MWAWVCVGGMVIWHLFLTCTGCLCMNFLNWPWPPWVPHIWLQNSQEVKVPVVLGHSRASSSKRTSRSIAMVLSDTGSDNYIICTLHIAMMHAMASHDPCRTLSSSLHQAGAASCSLLHKHVIQGNARNIPSLQQMGVQIRESWHGS